MGFTFIFTRIPLNAFATNKDDAVYVDVIDGLYRYNIYKNGIHDVVITYDNDKVVLNSEEIAVETKIMLSFLGGRDADYKDECTSVIKDISDETREKFDNAAVKTICVTIASVVFPGSGIAVGTAYDIFSHVATKIKEHAVNNLADGNAFYSFKQTTCTNNVVNTTLAKYYKHSINFYSGKNGTSMNVANNVV